MSARDNGSMQSKIEKYTTEIIDTYEKSSIVGHATSTKQVSTDVEFGRFFKFGNRHRFEKGRLFEPNTIFLASPLGIGIANSEANEVVRQIQQNAELRDHSGEQASYNMLSSIIHERFDHDLQPNFIFIPIDYFVLLHRWMDPTGRRGAIHYAEDGHYFVTQFGEKLKMKLSNKYTPFNDFMITSKNVNLWEYRPDSRTGHRLTVAFDTTSESLYDYLIVQTIFRFTILDPSASIRLRFAPLQQ